MGGPRSSDTSIAMSTRSAQILVSKYHSPIEDTILLREMADSSTQAGKYKVIPEHLIVPGSKAVLEKQEEKGVSNRHRSLAQKAPNGQSWNNSNNKIHSLVFNYNSKER